MATYTDVPAFKRDFYPDRKDVPPRFIQRAAAAAYNWINGKLFRWYSVPFSATYPPTIVDISDFTTKAITDFLIKKGRMPKVKEIAKDSPFDPATMLADICANRVTLLDSAGAEIARKSGVAPWSSTTGTLRVFDRDHEFNHEVSETDLDTLSKERSNH